MTALFPPPLRMGLRGWVSLREKSSVSEFLQAITMKKQIIKKAHNKAFNVKALLVCEKENAQQKISDFENEKSLCILLDSIIIPKFNLRAKNLFNVWELDLSKARFCDSNIFNEEAKIAIKKLFITSSDRAEFNLMRVKEALKDFGAI